MTWLFPLKMKIIGPTRDSMSFQKIDITKEVQVPLPEHVGAFGAKRRYDTHKGVDLYCPVGTEVFAVEDGVLCHIRPFTGKVAGLPWWENTWAVSIAGNSGIVVYGEIKWHGFKTVAQTSHKNNLQSFYIREREVRQGDLIGHVKQVLKKDKGRPTSMLHLALHAHGVLSNGVWKIGDSQPPGLLDPTLPLAESESWE